MTRHPEGYHIQIQEAADTNMLMTPGDDRSQFEGEPVRAKEKGLEKYIYVDWHRRGMFLDHFPVNKLPCKISRPANILNKATL